MAAGDEDLPDFGPFFDRVLLAVRDFLPTG